VSLCSSLSLSPSSFSLSCPPQRRQSSGGASIPTSTAASLTLESESTGTPGPESTTGAPARKDSVC
jgi:hypothetical protein